MSAYTIPIYLPRRRGIITPGEWLRERVRERQREKEETILRNVAPTFKAVSADATAASGNLTITMPGGGSAPVAGDLILIPMVSRDNVNSTVTNFNIATGYPYRPNATSQSYLFWKVSVGGEGNQTVNHTAGDGIVAGIIIIDKDTFDATTPIDGDSGDTNTTATFASYTTSTTDCLRLVMIGLRNDTNSVTNMADNVTPDITWTERYYAETGLSASDIGFSIWTGPDPLAQAASGTFTVGTSTSWATHTAVRAGPDAGGSLPMVARNTRRRNRM